MTHDEYRAQMERLKFKQCETHGALRGHVWFMLLCREKNIPITDRQWGCLQKYYDADEAAGRAVSDHAFSQNASQSGD